MKVPPRCGICNAERLKGHRRKRCKECWRLTCYTCMRGYQSGDVICSECLEDQFTHEVYHYEQQTSEDQMGIYLHGHLIYGIPWMRENVEREAPKDTGEKKAKRRQQRR